MRTHQLVLHWIESQLSEGQLSVGGRLPAERSLAEQLQVSRKGPGDFVSVADKRAEQTIVEELRNARPDWGLLLEEGGEIAGDPAKPRWIVDPLDGTTNFLHGIPIFSISIALERQGQLVAGVIYNPAMDELYTAERGGGAFLNDRRLRVAGRTKLSDAVIGTGPHVLQPVAVLRGTPIAYSLGNLAFGAPGRFAGYGKVGIGAVAHLRWDSSGLGTLRLDCVQTDNQLDGYVARACPAEPLAAARQVLGPGVSWQQDQASVTF